MATLSPTIFKALKNKKYMYNNIHLDISLKFLFYFTGSPDKGLIPSTWPKKTMILFAIFYRTRIVLIFPKIHIPYIKPSFFKDSATKVTEHRKAL